ncbi:CheR family methyltransferase [Priestia endophytica]|uniref:protein-glutamate O-methyltransferase n=1 Tax=Priestia endophytica TaxID=135735 RepID=A0AAX1QCV6_9BACI|nr:protein-glutamate O-methyltransferase CheR [Priestia endophytica]RAS79376.1 chemotaxis protein CheR [Priestia endophytica]RAS84049.1 chemotaxis protein CheR [Priestia endophytica]
MNDYEQFIFNIKKKTGIDLSLYKEPQMKRRLTSLYQKRHASSFMDFYRVLCEKDELLQEFLDRFTINVSEFYRNGSKWVELEKQILVPMLQKKHSLKIWSAACSTGEEPYTIAMILAQFLPLKSIRILATDIDETVLKKARKGVYGERELQELPLHMKTKYFTYREGLYYISEDIKNTVVFKKHDLLQDSFQSNYDLIVCRNVLIYFTDVAKHALYEKMSQSLKKGGVLFVGSTEQIFNTSSYGLTCSRPFFYRKE